MARTRRRVDAPHKIKAWACDLLRAKGVKAPRNLPDREVAVILNLVLPDCNSRAAKNALDDAYLRREQFVVPDAIPERKEKKREAYADYKESSDAFLASYEWRRLRMVALQKYGRRCQCCGATPETGAVMNVDHIKPRKLFPNLALDIGNLQVLCHECNHGKGNWDMTDFRPAQEEK